ncbi:MAG: hypothetical protein AABN95_01955 [Acidobacteriota bacterium]
MPSIREARLRHAAHYLALAQSKLKDWNGSDSDWNELEEYLQQVRSTWKWLGQSPSEPLAGNLLVACGDLAWELLDITHDRLSNLLFTLETSGPSSESESFQEQMITKLDEILLTQKRIQSALPDVYVFGDRNVSANNIINSTIYTGDVFPTL